MGLRVVLVALFMLTVTIAVSAEQQTSPIVYPRENSILGSRVNLVLDPTEVPFFQVIVGKTEYPVVDTSSGKHAYQGLELEPGLNTITVKVFAPPDEKETGKGTAKETAEGKGQAADQEKSAKSLILVSTWMRQVFSKVELLTTKPAPAAFKREFFHSRDRETGCAGCHNLEAPPRDAVPPRRPEDMICSVCHRKVPTGKNIHGPAALWYCLACHDPDAFPVKYQFTSFDPWSVEKTTHAVRPAVFTIPADALFKPQTAALLSEETTMVLTDEKQGKKKDNKKTQDLARALQAELAPKKEKQRELFAAFLEYVKLNPADRILVEAHVDNTPLPKDKGKKAKGFKDLQQLTDARAKVLAKVLQGYGITGKGRVTVAGMGSTLPKAPNTTSEGRSLNNRIEIVVSPPDVKVQNSMKLPVLDDRERLTVSMNYVRGPAISNLKVVERLVKGVQYVKGSGVFRGSVKDPQVKGEELVWQIGDLGTGFRESISYVLKKEKGVASAASPVVRLMYIAGQKEETRDFDPSRPVKLGLTVMETCNKCHPDLLADPFKHGPAVAGYCTVCHDPHASNHPASTRKQSWWLCTTCHGEKRTGKHVISGLGRGMSHPTKHKPDPARPGKRLSCVSCHSPHSARTRDLLAFRVGETYETCRYCHPK